jgi:hypothetical protein
VPGGWGAGGRAGGGAPRTHDVPVPVLGLGVGISNLLRRVAPPERYGGGDRVLR